MPFDRFLIAPINTGLQTDLRPWQIMDDAFTVLQNAYCFRGRVRKRSGSLLMGISPLLSRFRINIGTVSSNTIPGGSSQLQIGQMFSVGNDIFTIYQLGASASTLSTNTGATATINSTSNPNTVTFTGESSGATVYYYPALPVMGLTQYESGAINNHPSYGFDTQFAYKFTPNSGWNRSGNAIWHGNNTDYFWATNWQGSITEAAPGTPAMFVTNFNATVGAAKPTATDDPIWVTPDGTNWYPLNASSAMLGSGAANSSGFFFLPAYGGSPQTQFTGPFVQTARIIVPFKDRLLLLNTVENDNSTFGTTPGTGVATAYVNRCRYSFNGSPFARNAWYEPDQEDADTGSTAVDFNNVAAGANYIDATTEEQIISAEFIKDRLIVYFERSTWEIAYTGDETRPFVWQKLNTELGSQSTFSTVPFDQEILTIGNTGVHACNGSNVARIDEKIPDQIFKFEAGATERTCGIRDYYNELVYWSYVADGAPTTDTFPDQVLIYNYRNKTWAILDDCFTVYGYFEQQADETWANSTPTTWEGNNWTWVSGVSSANQRQILAGTPEGFVLRINDDESRNAPSMYITNISGTVGIITLTIYNHNLTNTPPEQPADQDYILIENIAGDVLTTFLNGNIYPVDSVIDANTITINIGPNTIGTYLGSGTAARVSNVQITTKQFNPYDKQDRNVFVEKANFFVQRTAAGVMTVDYSPSSTPLYMIQEGTATGAIMGTSLLETFPYLTSYTVSSGMIIPTGLEQYQDRLVHPVFFQSSGTCIQLRLYMNPVQMITPAIALSDFELEGIILYTQPTDSRME